MALGHEKSGGERNLADHGLDTVLSSRLTPGAEAEKTGPWLETERGS